MEGVAGWLGKLLSSQTETDATASDADLSVGLPEASHAFWARSDAKDKVIAAVAAWETSRASTEEGLKKAMAEQVCFRETDAIQR